MKTVIRNIAVISCSVFFSVAAHAAATTAQSVTSVAVVSSGNVIVKLAGPNINPFACTNGGYQIGDVPERKEWVAQLLTAKAAGQNVILNISESACNGNNPRITGVTLI